MRTASCKPAANVQPLDAVAEAATKRRRTNIAAEFGAEMQLEGKNFLSATDDDVAAFFAGVWLPQHVGTPLPDGSTVAAPGSLANAVCNLSAVFQRHGRNGLWQSSSGSGNLCHSEPMKALQQGYSKEAFRQGFAESAAVPLTCSSCAPS